MYTDWNIEEVKKYKIVIYEGLTNGKCKEVYDYFLNKGVLVIGIIASDESKKSLNGHFQDLKIVETSQYHQFVSKGEIGWVFCQNGNSEDKLKESLRKQGIKIWEFCDEKITLDDVNEYSDENENSIVNKSGRTLPKVIFLGKKNTLIVGKNVDIGAGVRLELHNAAKVVIGDYSRIASGTRIIVYDHSVVELGKYAIVGSECDFTSRYCSNVIIGDEVKIGHESQIFNKYNSTVNIGNESTFEKRTTIISVSESSIKIGDSNMCSFDTSIICGDGHGIFDVESGKRTNAGGDIYIGNRVWIGIKASVLGGARIEDDTVVGANSVVKKKHDSSHCILVGNPAREVREGIQWERYLLSI